MGSKISKAVRPRARKAVALAPSTPDTSTIAKSEQTIRRQGLSLPEIKPLLPLVVDVPALNATASTDSEADNTPAAATDNISMNALPDIDPRLLEPHPSTDAVDSLTQLLVADAQRFLDTVPPPPPMAPQPPVNALAPPPPPPPPPPEITCIICCEPKFSKDSEHVPVKACKPCGSIYCGPCLKDMFVSASKDLSRMPPRCCLQIPLYKARPYLTETEAIEFKSKYEEWSTPNPLYCPVPTCSVFIPNRLLSQPQPSNGKQRVDSVIGTPTSIELACPNCTNTICAKCRQPSHPGTMCGNLEFGVDEETAKLLKSWGYKRCPKCSNGVKRMFGCNHMECLCGAHWCWVCQKSNDECDGNCYEEDDEYSDEDDEVDEEPLGDDILPTTENAEEPTTAGESSATPAAASPAETVPPTRPRNLDAHSRGFWEDSGLNFGAEPSDNYADRSWDCSHDFNTTKVSFADSLRVGPSTTGIECSRCWNTVHPEIEMPNATNTGGARMVSGSIQGYTRAGRRTPQGYRRRYRRRLVRDDASIGEAMSNERVIDTYGRTITTAEVDSDSLRAASFDARPSSLTSDAWVQYSQSQHQVTGTHAHSPFSFAYECDHCGIVVCNTCKDAAMAIQKEREDREEAARAVQRAAREAHRLEQDRLAAERREAQRIEDERREAERIEAERLWELERPEREAREKKMTEEQEERWKSVENQEVVGMWLGDFDVAEDIVS